jgi:dipeptidyl aminopeptidase/acylaminoacyl peptidase
LAVKNFALLALVLLLLACPSGVAAQELRRPNGTIVAQAACAPFPARTYEQYVAQRKAAILEEIAQGAREGFHREPPADWAPLLLTRSDYERRQAYAGAECLRVTYVSDGLEVSGFIWKPKDVAGKRLPLIIFNRGGNREFSKLVPQTKWGFFDYVASAFVVIGSQYRGNDGGQGKEEFGGSDVDDVMNLIPLAKSLGYVDMNNVFLLGWSRGGMMTLLALKHGIAVNAAAVGGALADLVSERVQRSSVEEVFKDLIPHFAERTDETLRERSAIYWPGSIGVPLLILQGGADWRVSPLHNALVLAQELQEAGKTYELIVYADDDHTLSRNSADSDRRIIAWFKRYMK